jgi:hypothetical protein
MDRIVFHPWMRDVFVIHQADTRHDEAGLWGMRLSGGDEVARAVEIGPPDIVLILCPKDGGKVNDCRGALDGLLQRIRIEQVTLHACGPGRNFLARPHQRAEVDFSIRETPQ